MIIRTIKLFTMAIDKKIIKQVIKDKEKQLSSQQIIKK
jgi:hypothetical protein